MEPCQAARIWGRAGSSATSPSVDVQSVPRWITDSPSRATRNTACQEKTKSNLLNTWEVSVERLGPNKLRGLLE